MSAIQVFKQQVAERIKRLGENKPLQALSRKWFEESIRNQYGYNFSWLGRPIIQHPQDMIAIQELIWDLKPDLIIETGVAHGGSLIHSASLLELNVLGGGNSDAYVLGIDIDIRDHNRHEIEAHPMFKRITLLEGSSIATETVAEVHRHVSGKQCVMVILDSHHTHDHVLAELEAYARFVSNDSYCIVLDTYIEDMKETAFGDRPWSPGNNPKTAVHAYLKTLEQGEVRDINNVVMNYEIDKGIEHKILITAAPDGFLHRIK